MQGGVFFQGKIFLLRRVVGQKFFSQRSNLQPTQQNQNQTIWEED
jgi:hypothetical protein